MAQTPGAKPADKAATGVAKAGEKAEKAADKAADKTEKAADKAAGKVDGGAEKQDDKDKDKGEKKTPPKSDKAELKKKGAEQKAKLKGKVTAALKGSPATPAVKNELKRHAKTLARLERVEAVAKANGDDETATKVAKLITKENERHDKWLSKIEPAKGGAK